jgi:hypothetical protein
MTQVTTTTNAGTCAKEFAVPQHLLPAAIQVVSLDHSFQLLLRAQLSPTLHLKYDVIKKIW